MHLHFSYRLFSIIQWSRSQMMLFHLISYQRIVKRCNLFELVCNNVPLIIRFGCALALTTYDASLFNTTTLYCKTMQNIWRKTSGLAS